MWRFPPSDASLLTSPLPTAATPFVCLKMEKKNIKAYFASGEDAMLCKLQRRGMKFADCEPDNQTMNFNNSHQEGVNWR